MTRRRTRKNPAHCPCGSEVVYPKCCAPYHRGDAVAESPSTLVRARYSAYAKQELDYLIDTTDPDGDAWQKDLNQWQKDSRKFGRKHEFRGVKILSAEVQKESATIIFLARLRRHRRDASFTESSKFIRRDGQWLYSSSGPEYKS